MLFLTKKQWLGLGLGQVLSVLITGTGVFSQLLASRYNISIPTTQSSLNYVLLSSYFIYSLIRGKLNWKDRKSELLAYFLLAIVDVEANYFVVKAYKYTSITSVMLLDCFTIPSVMLLSRLFLGTRYNRRHFLGVAICLVGLVCLVLSDHFYNRHESNAKNPLLGDLLCIVSTILYAISNVGQEAMVKRNSQLEWLGMIGIGGTIVSAIQLSVLERNELQEISWNLPVVLLIVGFALCLFALYSLSPSMMILGSATLFNLSLLTSDVFAVVVSIFLFDTIPSVLYFLAFIMILIGLVVYNVSFEQPGYDKLDEETPNPKNQVKDIEEQ